MLLGCIIFGGIPIAIVSLIIYVIIYFVRKHKEERKTFLCHFMRYLLIACILSLVYLTILWGGIDVGVDYHLLNLRPFIWLTEVYEMGHAKMIEQLVTNIFMFLPYGFLLPIVFQKMRCWWKTDIAVAGFSFLIEFVQYFIGRSCDVDDLIMNTLGGCLGYGIFYLLQKFCGNKKWHENMLGK